MVTIEENHELLDIILGYKPDKPVEYLSVIFTCNVGEGLEFTLTSPSGTVESGIGTYNLYEGTWTYRAEASGYNTVENTIVVSKDNYGETFYVDIFLDRISGDVLVKGKGYFIDSNRDETAINYSLIDIFTGYQEGNYYVQEDQSSVVNGNYQYYKDFDSYYYNSYSSSEGYYVLTYFYKTYNTNIQELGDVKLLSNEYELSDRSSELIVCLKDVTTGDYVQGNIYGRSYPHYGYQDCINPDFDSYHDSWDINNPVGEHYLYIRNDGLCYFTLRFWGDYYADTFINITAVPGNWSGEPMTIYLTPKLKVDGLKAVLTWGEAPNDLDSHIKIYEDGNQLYHVFYSDKTYEVDGVIHVDLDVDDTSSYGPETTSIYVRDEGCMYYYYIYDYSGTDGIPEDTVISIYSEGRLLFTVTPDSLHRHDSSYRYWKVFSYNGSTQDIRIINKIVNYEPNENNWEE